jgi:hypothetical protein
MTESQKNYTRAAKIKWMMKVRGLTYGDIGHKTQVSLVIHGHRASHGTRKAIAEKLGVPYRRIWGRERRPRRMTAQRLAA